MSQPITNNNLKHNGIQFLYSAILVGFALFFARKLAIQIFNTPPAHTITATGIIFISWVTATITVGLVSQLTESTPQKALLFTYLSFLLVGATLSFLLLPFQIGLATLPVLAICSPLVQYANRGLN